MFLASGATGRAIVPSGASTGQFEAVELRDGGDRYLGKGVLTAVGHVNTTIRDALEGMEALDQRGVDLLMLDLDGTPNKANARRQRASSAPASPWPTPPPRRAGCRCGATSAGPTPTCCPVPMMNVLNGGVHADNNVDFQEFMIMPVGAASFSEALRWGVETYHTLKQLLHDRGLSTAVGDEGGFAPDLDANEDAIRLLIEAIERAGFTPGEQIAIALDPATTELYTDDGTYVLAGRGPHAHVGGDGRRVGPPGATPTRSCRSRTAWPRRTGTAGSCSPTRLGDRVQLVGDDLFVTNVERLQRGIDTAHGQRHPREGQPDRHAHRDARHGRPGHPVGLRRGDVAPLGGDRGRHHRRPRRRHQLRADQDRRPGPVRPRRQVQPAAAHRGGAGRHRGVPGAASADGSPAGARSAWSAAATGLVLALGLGVFPTRSFLDQRADVSDAERRLAVLREQNEALADQLEQLSTPEEIERLAREQYNLVRPGEEAYSVLPAPLPPLELPQVWPFGPLGGPPDAQ